MEGRLPANKSCTTPCCATANALSLTRSSTHRVTASDRMKSATEKVGNGVTGSSAVVVIGVGHRLINASIILNCLWNCDLADLSKSESNSENVFGWPICLHARNSAARINIEAADL